VFSLPQRHQEFAKLLQRLSNVYLQTQDDEILGNIALSLAHFGQSGHLRVDDVQQQLRQLATSLQTKLLTYIKAASNKEKEHGNNDDAETATQTQITETETISTNKNKRVSSSRRSSARLSSRSSTSSSDADQQTNTVATEVEEDACFSFALSIRRLNILTKRTNVVELLGDNDPAAANQLIKTLASYLENMPQMAKRPCHRGNKSSRFYQSMANAFQDGLAFLLCCAGWKLHMLVDALGLVEHSEDEISTTEPVSNEDTERYVQGILTLRDDMFSILGHAMKEAQQPSNKSDDESEYVPQPPSERAFVASMQLTCARVATDLRTLFPKEWANFPASSKLRELALSNEGQLIATSIRCLRSNEQHLMLTGDEDHEKESVQTLLLPIARSISTNWKGFGNRREAGVTLMFLTKAGKESSMLISTMNKQLKRAEPVRFLEAQMACLRQAYDEWINNEPEDLESDHPTEEEMAQYDEAEKTHNDQFRALESLAAKLSQSLGVVKLSPAIMKGLLGFAKEGIRCAFSTDDAGELILGSRLSFLGLVAKYAVWIKKNKAMRTALAIDLQLKEGQLRSHADFAEVHEDDIKSLLAFRVALGLKSSKNLLLQSSTDASLMSGGASTIGGGMDDTMDTSVAAASRSSMGSTMASTLVSNLGRRKSSTSSVASARSQLSARSSLMSPVFEKDSMSPTQTTFEGGAEEEEEEDSPMEAYTTQSKTQTTFEGSEGEDEDDEDHTTVASSVAAESSNEKRNRKMTQQPNATQNTYEEDPPEDEASSSADFSSNSDEDPSEGSSPRKRRRS
jgi:cohesin complex subunit SA-1/2